MVIVKVSNSLKIFQHNQGYNARKVISEVYAFFVLSLGGYQTNTDASILVYEFRLERTGFNMYADYTRPQLTFLAVVP